MDGEFKNGNALAVRFCDVNGLGFVGGVREECSDFLGMVGGAIGPEGGAEADPSVGVAWTDRADVRVCRHAGILGRWHCGCKGEVWDGTEPGELGKIVGYAEPDFRI